MVDAQPIELRDAARRWVSARREGAHSASSAPRAEQLAAREGDARAADPVECLRAARPRPAPPPRAAAAASLRPASAAALSSAAPRPRAMAAAGEDLPTFSQADRD